LDLVAAGFWPATIVWASTAPSAPVDSPTMEGPAAGSSPAFLAVRPVGGGRRGGGRDMERVGAREEGHGA
jgi:hypothetical protein